jgi:hypothetical protein
MVGIRRHVGDGLFDIIHLLHQLLKATVRFVDWSRERSINGSINYR